MTIPETLEEAAEIDGAGQLKIMMRIYLPLSAPILATVILFYAVGYWNSFFYATIFLNDSQYWTFSCKNLLKDSQFLFFDKILTQI